MIQSLAKAQIEAEVASRFGSVFKRGEKLPAHFASSGVSEIDALTSGGLPRGAITEIFGAASSGRISFLLSALSNATSNQEVCALIDISDTFDPASAANARVDFDQLLWVRCGNSLERAFKATDLLLQSGGFGFVALNLADVAAKNTRRIISSWWFRFRRALESTPTVLMVVTPVACVRSCAAAVLEIRKEDAAWPHTRLDLTSESESTVKGEKTQSRNNSHQLSLVTGSKRTIKGQLSFPTYSYLLRGVSVRVNREKPVSSIYESARFSPQAYL